MRTLIRDNEGGVHQHSAKSQKIIAQHCRWFRSSLSTVLVRETSQPKRPSTCNFSYLLSSPPETMSSLVLMDLIKYKKSKTVPTEPQPHQYWITISTDHPMPLLIIDISAFCSELGSAPKQRKLMVVSVRPHYSHDPHGPKYEQYYQQKLMLHVPFRHIDQLKGTFETFSDAYLIFLQSGNIPPTLEDDIRRLRKHQVEQEDEDANEVCNIVYVCVHFIIFLTQECLTHNQHREAEANLSP